LTLALVLGKAADRKRVRAALLAGAWLTGIAVAASRVYLGVHYPSDVVGGLALGTGWAFALEALFDWWEARKREHGELPDAPRGCWPSAATSSRPRASLRSLEAT